MRQSWRGTLLHEWKDAVCAGGVGACSRCTLTALSLLQVVTPVRRSARFQGTHAPVQDLLEQTNYTYGECFETTAGMFSCPTTPAPGALHLLSMLCISVKLSVCCAVPNDAFLPGVAKHDKGSTLQRASSKVRALSCANTTLHHKMPVPTGSSCHVGRCLAAVLACIRARLASTTPRVAWCRSIRSRRPQTQLSACVAAPSVDQGWTDREQGQLGRRKLPCR